MDTLEHYKQKGWALIPNAMPKNDIEFLKEYSLEIKDKLLKNPDLFMNTKPNGSGIWWRGLDLSSRSTLGVKKDAQRLWAIYSSEYMYNIATKFLETDTIFFFNDQLVTKLPNEPFGFPEHADNDFHPPQDYIEGGYKSINVFCVIDTFTKQNGHLEVKNVDDEKWVDLFPNEGDIILIEGDTIHRSGENKSDSPRRAYACVYTTKSVGKNWKKGHHYDQFII